jgi:hypothetical protein
MIFPRLRLLVQTPGGWEDVTAQGSTSKGLDSLLLQRRRGVGRLHFGSVSAASEADANLTPDRLLSGVESFARSQGLGTALTTAATNAGTLCVARGDYQKDNEFYRVHHVSDGKYSVIAVYRAPWGQEKTELRSVDRIVRQLSFPPAPGDGSAKGRSAKKPVPKAKKK